jgi:transaldolase
MALFLDSAVREDGLRTASLGFVSGVTTNPSLIARSGMTPEEAIRGLLAMADWPVFYQVTGETRDEIEAEARRMTALAPGRVVIKAMADMSHLQIMAGLSDGLRWAATAVCSGAQAYLACQAGAEYLIPYVNRSTRYGGDGIGVVREIVAMTEACGGTTQVLAASLKSAREVVDTILAGAHHVSMPLAIIDEMAVHPLTTLAAEDFRRAVRPAKG